MVKEETISTKARGKGGPGQLIVHTTLTYAAHMLCTQLNRHICLCAIYNLVCHLSPSYLLSSVLCAYIRTYIQSLFLYGNCTLKAILFLDISMMSLHAVMIIKAAIIMMPGNAYIYETM